jgi:predicted ATPase with chaperone activity
LQVTGRGLELDASGDDAAQFMACAYHRIFILARTIADPAESEEIKSAHLAEALHASHSSEDHDGVIKPS